MKRALYYAIRTGSLYNPVVAVTSEKPHRWFGRNVKYDEPTHGLKTDLSGRFDTVEAALAARDNIVKVADSYDEARKVLARASDKLYAQERDAIEALLRDGTVQLAPIPTVTY